MEICAQCGGQAEQHPVVAIMNTMDIPSARGTILKSDPSGRWAAFAMCPLCHQEPKLKAHYFMRRDADIALRLADFKNLQLPGR